MRRFGYGTSTPALRALIREVLQQRAPELLGIADVLGVEPLTQEQREAVREVLAEELVEDGLGPDDEPNERGRFVEAAIDWLGHQ